MDTLVIDRNGLPVSFIDWQRAVSLCYTDKAHILHQDQSKILRSPCFEMGMPRVIQLKNNVSKKLFRAHVPFSRRNVAIRDNSTCQYCGQVLNTHQYTFDHVNPRSQGGVSSWENLVLSCLKCNTTKRDRTPKQARMHPLTKPVEPSARDKRFNFKLHVDKLRPEWAPWSAWISGTWASAEKAGWEYWSVELEK